MKASNREHYVLLQAKSSSCRSSSLASLTTLQSLVFRLQARKMAEIRSRQLRNANYTQNLQLAIQPKLHGAEGTSGIIPIRHEKHGVVDRYCSTGSTMLP